MQTTTNILKGVLAAAVLLAAVGGFAEEKGPMFLAQPTTIGGKVLASGVYKLRWKGTGDQVQLKIYQGKKEVVTVPARVIQLSLPADANGAVVESKDGTRSLSAVRFQGKKFALRIAGDAGTASSARASK